MNYCIFQRAVFSPLSTISGESIYFKNKTIILDHKLFKYDNKKYLNFSNNILIGTIFQK